MPSVGRVRNWFATIHDVDFDPSSAFSLDRVKYCVWQKEVGKETQKEHLQLYVEFKQPMTLAGMKKISPTAHWEKRMGTAEQARHYCTKEDTRVDGPWEIGKWTTQGERSDLTEVTDLALQGASQQEIATTYPNTWVRYSRGIQSLQAARLGPYMHDKVRGIWIHGEPRIGKTTHVYETYGFENVYMKDATNKWFDGYNGESVICMDDTDHRSTEFSNLLKRWADKFPVRGEVKGGSVELQHKFFICTSNYTIDHLWPSDTELIKALEGRFEYVKFEKKW